MATILSRIAGVLPFTNISRFNAYAKTAVEAAPCNEIERIKSILSFVHAHGGSGFSLQIYKMLSLANLCEKIQPMSILEIGSGASTPIFAAYAAKNNAKVVSVEESPEWLAASQDLINRFDNLNMVEFVLADTEWRVDVDPPEVRYKGVQKRHYDLIFVDGPSLIYNGHDLKKDVVCMDALDFAMKDCVANIVVDMRLPTVRYLEKNLPLSWNREISDVLARNPRDKFSYYSVFSRC